MRNTPPGTPGTPRRVRSAHESKSAAVRAAAAAPSRRQQSKWQREQQQQHLLFIAVGALVVLVGAIFAGGLIYDNVVRANEVVAQVGSENITAAQLVDEVRPQARALDSQAKQVGSGPSITDYLDQQKRGLPDQVLNDTVDQRIISQEAARRGITVTPAEVDSKERQSVADFQASSNPAPTPQPTTEAAATPEPASSAAETPTATAVAKPTAIPTLEASAYGPALQDLLDKNGLTEADFRQRLEQNTLRDKVQAAIGEDQVPATQEQVHVRDIVVADQDTANSLLSQLHGGADFASLASQNSTDASTKLNGGDAGWLARGQSGKSKTFEDAAFALQEPNQLSDVFQDTDGFHIIQLVERDSARPFPDAQLTTLRQKAFSDLLSAQRSQNVKLQFNQSEKDWVLGRIGVRP
jgi:parvulin-like peptidyl-prolyl isomerase